MIGSTINARYPQQLLFDLAKSLYEDWADTKTKVADFKAVRSNHHVHDDGKNEVSHNFHHYHPFLFAKGIY